MLQRLIGAAVRRTPDDVLDALPGDLRDVVAHRYRQTAQDRKIIAGYDAEGDEGRYSLDGQDRLSAVFVRVPKTASISVCAILLGDRGGAHRTARDYKRIYGPREYRRRFSFAFVRDPYARLVSVYTYLKGGGRTDYDRRFADEHLSEVESFEQFVLGWLDEQTMMKGIHLRSQTHFVCDRDRVAVDFVGRFEHLDRDFAHVARTLGVMDEHGEPVTLPHKNSTGRKRAVDSFYTPEVRERVADLYAADFETFEYPV